MKMRSQTRLVRRGPVYYFRARIPEDFTPEQRQQLLAKWHQRPARLRFVRGKVIVAAEIMQSLQTKDKKAAESLVRIKSVELDGLIETLRQGVSAAPPQTTITDAEISRIVAKATASRMGADEATRTLGLSEEDFARHLKWLESLEATTTMAIARGNFAAIQELADDWLDGHNYQLPKDSEGYRRFYYEFAKAQARVNQQLRARDRGEVVDTPAAPLELPAQGQRDGNLTALCEYWQQQKKPRPKTIIEAESILRRFRDVHGNLAPANVTRRHVIAFRDALVEQGKAPGTVKKLLGLFGSMFQVALEDDSRFGVETNPSRDVKVRGEVGQEKERRPFTVDELNTIFASAVFARGDRPAAGAGEASYWIPLLGLFTGARLNEIGQLCLSDVKDEGGIVFFHFTNQGEGQYLKQGGKSRKRVPIHPELVRLGFLRYVKRMREEAHVRLFPSLQADSHGHITGRWSKWFNRYLDGVVGITDSKVDFHSFRHTFKQAARSSGIPEDQHDALTGHANASVSRAYGNAEGYPLGQLARSIKRLKFPRVELAKV